MNALRIISSILWMAILAGCGSADRAALDGGDTLTSRAEQLMMIDHGGYISVQIANPWKEDQTLARYYLVHRDSVMPDLPDDGKVIKVPVRSAAVFSGVHTSGINELGHGKSIVAVADGQYFVDDPVKSGLVLGQIVDVGPSTSPSIEKLVDVSPEVLIVSPYQDSDHSAIEKTGIAVLQMTDYMEKTPLGRAEWLLLIGALYDDMDKARSIYQDVTSSYESLMGKTAGGARPLVLTEMPMSGVWHCPAGGSYAARMIKDAGGEVLFGDDESTGSVQADVAKVYDLGADADFWLIRSYGPLNRQTLASMSAMIPNIKAFKQGRVYVCDTSSSPLFDDIAFHPERVLADYIKIFSVDSTLHYFSPLK